MKRKIAVLLLLCTILTFAATCTVYGAEKEVVPEYTKFSDFKGKTVSMLDGAPFENLMYAKCKDIKGCTYYEKFPDTLLALRSGKTDAVIANEGACLLTVNREPDIVMFPEILSPAEIGFCFSKGNPLRAEFQKAYDKISKDTLDELYKIWTGTDASKKVLPEVDWPGTNGTYKVAACDTLEPMSYSGEGNTHIGFDENVLLLMAKEMDVHLEFVGMEFAAILPSVQSGKCDLGCGSIFITDERKKTVDFVPYYKSSFCLLVRGTNPNNGTGSTFTSIGESFKKTFIVEDRYKLVLYGLLTTIIITLLSIIFGIILGFLAYMLCRNGNRIANGITNFCIWLVEGLPVIVLLMVLYYVVFAKSSIPGTAVSVIAFTLVFGAGVFGMLSTGVSAVDYGQTEASYALGFSNRQTFYTVVLPQAMEYIVPMFKSQVKALVKATAIVGYIAVEDLTKMGDIIRSRTYEAFFPLFAVALIYLALVALMTFGIGKIADRFDPKRRSKEKILKGIEDND